MLESQSICVIYDRYPDCRQFITELKEELIILDEDNTENVLVYCAFYERASMEITQTTRIQIQEASNKMKITYL